MKSLAELQAIKEKMKNKVVIREGGEEIILDEDTINKARVCIDKMIELG